SQKEVISKLMGEEITSIRLNFAGGEPLLLKKNIFNKIVIKAKEMGFDTSLITNGSLLESHSNILEHLNMIGISIDSLDRATCLNIGRYFGKNYLSKEKLENIINIIKLNNYKIGLKFNIVVSKYNYNTNIVEQLQAYKPHRLKILRQLSFDGEDCVSDEQFRHFLRINGESIKKENVVIEDEDKMIQGYLMIDPSGRFFQNGNGQKYRYSDPIFEVGLERAFSQVAFDKGKFKSRYSM
ncbi:MAG: viperin family antiviral radical SAM protein, partial [Campylobacteraceae bacterium]|nr:viperin family antiviral radical SAM protein [Campylobacteraceae bacterium]